MMLDRGTFSKIRRIQIRTRSILESGIVGAYHAVFKGRGMEFAEVREYAPGDDVRTIDWNVTARMGDALRQEVRRGARPDAALAGGRLGLAAASARASCSKRDYAAELAAVLAFSAVANHDRVGRGPLHRPHRVVRRRRGRGATTPLRIVRDLLARRARRGAEPTCAAALRLARQRAEAARHRARSSPTSRPSGYERRSGILQAPPRRRWRCTCGTRREAERACGRAAGSSVDPETGALQVGGHLAAPRCAGGWRAATLRGGARRVPARTRVDALPLCHGRVLTTARWRRSSRRGEAPVRRARAGPGARGRRAPRVARRGARWRTTVAASPSKSGPARGRGLRGRAEGRRAPREPRSSSFPEAGHTESVELRRRGRTAASALLPSSGRHATTTRVVVRCSATSTLPGDLRARTGCADGTDGQWPPSRSGCRDRVACCRRIEAAAARGHPWARCTLRIGRPHSGSRWASAALLVAGARGVAGGAGAGPRPRPLRPPPGWRPTSEALDALGRPGARPGWPSAASTARYYIALSEIAEALPGGAAWERPSSR